MKSHLMGWIFFLALSATMVWATGGRDFYKSTGESTLLLDAVIIVVWVFILGGVVLGALVGEKSGWSNSRAEPDPDEKPVVGKSMKGQLAGWIVFLALIATLVWFIGGR